MAKFVPEQLESKSEVLIEKDEDGFSITSVHLTLIAKIPGIDNATFQSIAMKAKARCPVSKLMNVEIGFEGKTARQIFGPIDEMKFRSSMTLFITAAPDEPLFSRCLEKYFGRPDPATLEILSA